MELREDERADVGVGKDSEEVEKELEDVRNSSAKIYLSRLTVFCGGMTRIYSVSDKSI